MKRILPLTLAILIVAGPAVAQLLRVDSPIFRPWKMYGTVAIGAAFGNFQITRLNSTVHLIAIPEALGLSQYREQQPYPGSGAITRDISGTDALAEVAAPLCNELRQDESLSFKGRIATRHRWVLVELDQKALCESTN